MRGRILLAAIMLLAHTAQAETIAVIGTGNVGMALGTEFAAQGHTIIYGSRSPLSLKTLDLVKKTGPGTEGKRPADAAAAYRVQAEVARFLDDLRQDLRIARIQVDLAIGVFVRVDTELIQNAALLLIQQIK